MFQCEGKKAWTRQQAIHAADSASKRTGELIVHYECANCGMFHIGHATHHQLLAFAARRTDPATAHQIISGYPSTVLDSSHQNPFLIRCILRH